MNKLLFGVIALLLSFEALACSCKYHGLLEKWQLAEHVFIAEVKDVKILKESDAKNFQEGKVQGNIAVLSSFKGQPDLITSLSAAHKPVCCTCSTTIKRDKYVVFASKAGELTLSSCSMTSLLSNTPYYEEVLTQLKSGAAAQQYVGKYNTRKRVLTLDSGTKSIPVHEFFYDFEVTNNDVVIEGFPLKDGSIFLTSIDTVTPLDND
ncbi:hypothetical protein [Litorilituus lipolyticus]|uniref:Uncharacterized protein n=1 Tax=Litorilituus lipolyticus TaxID=2491017 RepID=A0A502KZ91_9GAMM|nr:hypothetical protein [Litorilituus lipolyticus]TPH13587.1 hypothetical protein EPA86_13375 [Litorilituus lipolyticus]